MNCMLGTASPLRNYSVRGRFWHQRRPCAEVRWPRACRMTAPGRGQPAEHSRVMSAFLVCRRNQPVRSRPTTDLKSARSLRWVDSGCLTGPTGGGDGFRSPFRPIVAFGQFPPAAKAPVAGLGARPENRQFLDRSARACYRFSESNRKAGSRVSWGRERRSRFRAK
jgi:hypothetical protein